jgi:hypothetical protein
MIFQKEKAKRSLLEEFPEQVIKPVGEPLKGTSINAAVRPYSGDREYR